jgi:hypothetical protein
MRIIRILRGIVLTALTWAVAWVPVSLILIGLATLFGVHLAPGFLSRYLIVQAIVGAINGGVFASILAIAGRRKTFETLSMPWIATCGALGGALIPFAGRVLLSASFALPVTALISIFVTSALLGAAGATLTLSIARRAPAFPRSDNAARPALDSSAA